MVLLRGYILLTFDIGNCFVLGLCIVVSSQKNLEDSFFVSNDDLVDFVTSSERCSQEGDTLATFTPFDNSTLILNGTMKLQPRTKYWIKVQNESFHMNYTHCPVLSVLAHPNKFRYEITKCERKLRYICTRHKSVFSKTDGHGISPSAPLRVMSIETTAIPHGFVAKEIETSSIPTDLYPSVAAIFTSEIESSESTTSSFSPTNHYTSSLWEGKVYSSFHSLEHSAFPESTIAYCERIPELTSYYKLQQIPESCPRTKLEGICEICCSFCKQENLNVTYPDNISNTTNLNLFPELEINARETGKALRRKKSATDTRPSTRAMGVAASFVICSVVLFIIILDLPVILEQFRQDRRTECISEC